MNTAVSGKSKPQRGYAQFGMVARYAERYDRRKDLMIQQLRFQVEAALQMDVRSIVRAERLRTG